MLDVEVQLKTIGKKDIAETALVTVVDEADAGVEGATVHGRWSGLVDASQTDVTGATGEANFTSPKTPISRPRTLSTPAAWSASTDRAQSYPEADTNPFKKTNMLGKLGTWGKIGSSARFAGKVFYG